MLDFVQGVPARGKTDIFYPQGSSVARGVQIWNKPRNATMIHFLAVGGGGGGGAGFTRAAGTAGGGGGGGASSGIARFLVPAIFVPDILYIFVAVGGQGGRPGVSSGNGTAGANSFIATCPPLTAGTLTPLPNLWLSSGVNVPGGGGGGAVGAAGAAGTVPTIAVIQPHHLYGNWVATVGLVGVAGGAHTGANGTAVTCWAANMFSPGAGGGGIATTVDFTGGAQTLTARYSVAGRAEMATTAIPGGVANGGNGNAGLKSITPFLNSGGSGGGTDDNGQAGGGGTGGYGCGGGGGGAGATAGNGGNGGDGIVIISSW